MDKYLSKYTTYNVSEENFVFDKKIFNYQNLILLDSSNFKEKENIEALNKILLSIGLKTEENTHVQPLKKNQTLSLNSNEFREETWILCFGIAPSDLGLQGFVELHTPFSFKNFRLLFAAEIKDYIHDKNNKLKLWNALKEWKKIQ